MREPFKAISEDGNVITLYPDKYNHDDVMDPTPWMWDEMRRHKFKLLEDGGYEHPETETIYYPITE